MHKALTGVLLLNLGTPTSPDEKAIRAYLKEFLSDPRVIDLPWIIRKILLYFYILPFRTKQCAKAYQAIWYQENSPLLFHSQELLQKLKTRLGKDYRIELAMRYGQPNIKDVFENLLQYSDEIIVLPLFPQYSSAATGSAIEKVLSILKQKWNIPSVKIIQDFYANTSYINAFSTFLHLHLQNFSYEKLIFSYHSLPTRHILKGKSNCLNACMQREECPPINSTIKNCYRAKCFETSRLVAEKLKFSSDQYEVVFQSRLGKTPWIGPDIEQLMKKMRIQNIKNVAIVCPSFVADCLETLEEIGMRAKAQWESLGGETFTLIPSLNASDIWVDALVSIIKS